ncbi:hypothetical protein KGF54_005150 [Candida jiufengensis]|uniref:uncharacterized protein n=1 Tax=Candida jiufengensis TaxID=497108 RepID=UPI002225041F|nr:uncharacterized protein KGF54_005150 [Candida jiufengensis]KAI5950333.1 hypothetical protein KGF54_005150 [Candida jiufengensis]
MSSNEILSTLGSNDNKITINDLPNEILLQIFNYVPISTIKQILLFPKLNLVAQYHIYDKCQYCLQVNDDNILSVNNTNDSASEISQNIEQNGYNIIDDKGLTTATTINHIKRFKTYKIILNIIRFEDILKKLKENESIINEIIYKDQKAPLNINISIKLNYSISNFNDVKDCFFNIDFISSIFNENDVNNVSIDLQLNKQLW